MTGARFGDRSQFPDLEAAVYLNHAAISPPSLAVRAAVTGVLDAYATRGTGAWMEYREQRDALRADLARMVGATPDDIALVPSTSQGLADVALCIPWRTGDRIVVFEGEFPTNVTPWQQAAASFGAEVVFHRVADFEGDAAEGLARLATELERGVRVVAVSAVQFQSGLRMPLRAIADLCHAHGAEICVDAMQAVGVVPTDVRALDLDYMVVGSHKWLMGIEGAGFVYVAPRCIGALRPTVAGWLSHDEPASFLFEGKGHLRYDRPIRPKADFLEVGAMATAGFAALGASVSILLELGIDAVYRHVQQMHDELEPALLGLGLRSLRASDPDRRSGILGFELPDGVALGATWEALGRAGIQCSTPDGVLRFAPHWPNDVTQMEQVADAVANALAG